MSRATRQYINGGVFHITARTQGKRPWFTQRLRGVVVEIIVKGVALSDAKLLAYAVMPNHFHMVVVQGGMTLGTVMQPIMRRIALLIQRSRKCSGHVFERSSQLRVRRSRLRSLGNHLHASQPMARRTMQRSVRLQVDVPRDLPRQNGVVLVCNTTFR